MSEEEEQLSKNALKKKLKAEKAAQAKAEKEAKKAAEGEGTGKASKKAENEDDLDPTQFKANRETMVKSLEEEGGNPYPHKFDVDFRLPEYVAEFQPKTTDGERLTDKEVSVAGRIISVRGQGKLFFYDIRGDGAKVQVMSDLKSYAEGEDAFYKIHRILRRGISLASRDSLVEARMANFPSFPPISSC